MARRSSARPSPSSAQRIALREIALSRAATVIERPTPTAFCRLASPSGTLSAQSAAAVFFALFLLLFLVLWGLLTLALPPLWHGLRALANRLSSTPMRYGLVQRAVRATGPFRDYLPVAVLLVVGIVVCALAGDGFLDLAERVRANSPALKHFDTFVHDWAVHKREEPATVFFDVMSTIGGPPGLAVLELIVCAFLLWKRRFWWIGYLLVTTGIGIALIEELKHYFARSRPDVAEMLMRAHGYSFPSGHAMGSTIVFGALSYLAFRALDLWWQRAAAIALAWTIIISVALSRVYLGVHWISDVSAGIVCGILWVTIATVGYESLRRIRTIRAVRRRAAVHMTSSIREGARGA